MLEAYLLQIDIYEWMPECYTRPLILFNKKTAMKTNTYAEN